MHSIVRCRDSSRQRPESVAKNRLGKTPKYYSFVPQGRVHAVLPTVLRIGRGEGCNNQERLLELDLRAPQMAVNNTEYYEKEGGGGSSGGLIRTGIVSVGRWPKTRRKRIKAAAAIHGQALLKSRNPSTSRPAWNARLTV